MRPGREYLFSVNFGNEGDADGVAPLLIVENLDASPFALERHHLGAEPVEAGQIIQVLGISHDGAAGVLRPGMLDSVPMFFRPLSQAVVGRFRLHTVTAADTRPFDFAQFEEQFRPASVTDSEWAAVRPRLAALIGSTWGSYVQALAQAATRLSDLGFRTSDLPHLFRELYRQARADEEITASGFVAGTADCIPVTGASIRAFGADGGLVAVSSSNANAYFAFNRLAPDTYRLVIDADGYARQIIDGVTVPADGQARRNIHLEEGSVITGTLALTSEQFASGQTAVTAQCAGSAGTEYLFHAKLIDGRFTFDSLPVGSYDLAFRHPGFLVRRLNGVNVEAAQALDLGAVILAPAASIAGTIHLGSGASLPAGLGVGAYNGETLVGSGIVDATSHYQIGSLVPGSYTLRLVGLVDGYSEPRSFTVQGAESLQGLDLTVYSGSAGMATPISNNLPVY